MSTPPSADGARPPAHRRRHGGSAPTPAPAWDAARLRALLLGPGWRPSFVIALVAGGVSGVLPVAAFGEPGLGVVAGAAQGWVGAGVLSMVWIPPIVATAVCAEREVGIAAVRFAAGTSGTALRRRRRVDALLVVGVCLVGAALMGVLGALLANAFTPGDWSLGWAGRPVPDELALGSVAAAIATTLSWSVSELAPRRQLAVLLLEGSLLVTALLLGVLYFAPVLAPLQVLSPWIGIWPLRASTARSPLLASDLDQTLAAGITLGWTCAFGLAAAFADRPLYPPRQEGT